MLRESDVVVVGGGIAGAALTAVLAANGVSVTMLERQESYRDIVRGEVLMPWGVAEAIRMGLGERLYEGGAWTLRWWRLWDETVSIDEAPFIDLSTNAIPGVEGPVTLSHYQTCAAFNAAARAAEADVVHGVHDVKLDLDGAHPVVTFGSPDGEQSIRTRLVVGAGGRNGRIGKQAGIAIEGEWHHWGGGLLVEGLDEWPDDTQAMGTEGDNMFFIFPQGGGRARLYLNYRQETAAQFSGPQKVANFLSAFNLTSVPGSEEIAAARPIGPMACYPSLSSWAKFEPFVDGVVLAGDEAGMCDNILGTGLANALRDTRIISDILLESRDWSAAAFKPYAEERAERMKRMHLCANLMAKLWAEFGDEARARRRRALDLMRNNPGYALFLLVALNGPEALPDARFVDYLSDRLLDGEVSRVAS